MGREDVSAWIWLITLGWDMPSIYHPIRIVKANIKDIVELREINDHLAHVHKILGAPKPYARSTAYEEIGHFERMWLALPQALFVCGGSWDKTLKDMGYEDAEIFKEVDRGEGA